MRCFSCAWGACMSRTLIPTPNPSSRIAIAREHTGLGREAPGQTNKHPQAPRQIAAESSVYCMMITRIVVAWIESRTISVGPIFQGLPPPLSREPGELRLCMSLSTFSKTSGPVLGWMLVISLKRRARLAAYHGKSGSEN